MVSHCKTENKLLVRKQKGTKLKVLKEGPLVHLSSWAVLGKWVEEALLDKCPCMPVSVFAAFLT